MADYYCKCNDCDNVNPKERKGYKWYCEVRRIYVDPDEIIECKYHS